MTCYGCVVCNTPIWCQPLLFVTIYNGQMTNLATYSNQIMESYNCYLILLWAYFEANNMQTLYNAIHGGKSSLYSKNLQQFI